MPSDVTSLVLVCASAEHVFGRPVFVDGATHPRLPSPLGHDLIVAGGCVALRRILAGVVPGPWVRQVCLAPHGIDAAGRVSLLTAGTGGRPDCGPPRSGDRP